MRKDIRSSTSPIALGAPFPLPSLGDALEEVSLSVDRFCLLAGIEALAEMMEEDATAVCGARPVRLRQFLFQCFQTASSPEATPEFKLKAYVIDFSFLFVP